MMLRKDQNLVQPNAKPGLHPVLGGGTIGLISGENPRFPAAQQGHEALGQELHRMGLLAEPTVGHYGGIERSYIVHNPTRDQMVELGRRFGQESVIHSDKGQHHLIYTNGPQAGQHHRATGYEVFDKAPEDFYTVLPSRDGVPVGYFRYNFDTSGPPDVIKKYGPHDLAQRLGEALRGRIEAYQAQLLDLRKKELAKASLQQQTPHQEPGVHEQAGSSHLEPGVHEKFANRPPDDVEKNDLMEKTVMSNTQKQLFELGKRPFKAGQKVYQTLHTGEKVPYVISRNEYQMMRYMGVDHPHVHIKPDGWKGSNVSEGWYPLGALHFEDKMKENKQEKAEMKINPEANGGPVKVQKSETTADPQEFGVKLSKAIKKFVAKGEAGAIEPGEKSAEGAGKGIAGSGDKALSSVRKEELKSIEPGEVSAEGAGKGIPGSGEKAMDAVHKDELDAGESSGDHAGKGIPGSGDPALDAVKKEELDPKAPVVPDSAWKDCTGCGRKMNPVEVLLAAKAMACGRCVRKQAVVKGEDFISLEGENSHSERLKDPRPVKGAVRPGDKKSKKVDAPGSGGEIVAVKKSEEDYDAKRAAFKGHEGDEHYKTAQKLLSGHESHSLDDQYDRHLVAMTIAAHLRGGKKTKKAEMAVPKAPKAPKPPQAVGAKPIMQKDVGAPGARNVGWGALKTEKSEKVEKGLMSGMGKMPKEAQAQAAKDSHQAVAQTVPPAEERAVPKAPTTYDAKLYQPSGGDVPVAPAPKKGFVSPVKHHLDKLKIPAKLPMAGLSNVVGKNAIWGEMKSESMCKKCGTEMAKGHTC
jgi:hypothetical protein